MFRLFSTPLICLTLFVASLSLSAVSADAARKPVVGVFPFQSAESSLSRRDLRSLSKQLVAQLEITGKVKLSRRYPMSGHNRKVTPNQQTLKLKELRPLSIQLRQVATLIRTTKFEKALATAKKGIGRAEQLIHWNESFPILGRLLALGAIACLQLGQNDEAEELLKRLAILKMKKLPPEIQRNRIMRYRYKRAQRSIRSVQQGSIQVIGTPGASVYVDGRLRGKIPLALSGLPQGKHYIHITKQGFLTWGRVLNMKSANTRVRAYLTARVQATLNKPLARATQELVTALQSGSVKNPNLKTSLRQICRSGNVEWFFTAGLKKASPRYYLLTPYRVRCSTLSVTSYEALQLATELLDTDSHIQRLARLMEIKPGAVNNGATGNGKNKHLVSIGKDPDKKKPKVKGGNGGAVAGIVIGVIVVGAGAGAAAYFLLRDPRIKVTAKWSP